MKIIDNTLFIEWRECLECGLKDNTLKSLKTRKPQNFMDDPDDKRRVLTAYEPLSQGYKEAIQKRFGNPYDYVAKEPIKKLVVKDLAAEDFFIHHKLPDGTGLPAEYVDAYTTAASWLNMISKVKDEPRIAKKELGLTMDEFWRNVCEIIEKDSIKLPSSYRRLLVNEDSALKQYKANGYASLISKRFGNSNATKLTDELSKDVLIDIISNHNQHDDTIILMAYNRWADQNGKKPILTPQTIGNFRRENGYLVTTEREGNAAFYNKYGKVIKGRRPGAPLFLVEHDDNDLDKYFKDGNNNYFRFKLIVVKDAFNDYPLGWAAGDEVSIELVQAAYLDAMHHIKGLTGGWYLPHQLKSDRWGIDKDLTTQLGKFYKKIDPDFFPAAAKGPRGKYIEQSFGTRWHQYLKMDELNNYAGNNITSQSRINADALQLHKKDFPDKKTGIFYIEAFINAVRMHRLDNGQTLQQQWAEAFAASEVSKERQISRTKMLMTFGTPHIVPQAKCPEFPNRITNSGIELQILNQDYNYDIPDEHYLPNVGKNIQVVFDPLDMSNVLVHDGNKLRFIAGEMNTVARTRIEMNESEQARYWKKMHQKRMHMQLVADAAAARKERLYKAGVNTSKLLALPGMPDPEALLQAGVMVKEIKQATEAAYTKKQLAASVKNEAWEAQYENWLDNNNDFDKFFNNPSSSTP